MNKRLWPDRRPLRKPSLSGSFLALLALGLVLSASGCQKDVVHQRSIAELNQKAQVLMQSGDYAGAIGRLEAAHDLEPDEPNTTHNLAVAYQSQGNYDKAIAMFTQLLDKPEGMDKAEIQKALAITYEAKADKLSNDAKSMADDPKADKTKVQQENQEAGQAYQMALSYYKQAVTGVKDAEQVRNQITALETKLKNPNSASTR